MDNNFSYQNKKILYRSFGSGKPVILVHGFGEDGNVWNNQVEYLKDKCRLIVPDLPGSGRSEIIDDMSVEGMAEVVHSIIHEENLDTCILIGHSMGGYITLAFAEKYWNHLDAFGLFHSTAFADPEEKKVTRRKGIGFIRKEGAFEFLKTTTPNLFSPVSKLRIPETIAEFIQSLSNFSPIALVKYYEAIMQRPDRVQILKRAKIPVLFTMGKYDNAIPLEDGLKQCHLPGKSYIHILHESGHMGMLEEAATSNRILEQFILDT